jgi:hypothetical protein
VRELRNTLERALSMWPTKLIEPEAFPERMTGTVRLRPIVGDDFFLEAIERDHILRVMHRTPTPERAAEILNIDATYLLAVFYPSMSTSHLRGRPPRARSPNLGRRAASRPTLKSVSAGLMTPRFLHSSSLPSIRRR